MTCIMAEKVLCVRPSCFGYNEDTADTNSFQSREQAGDPYMIQELAQAEFDSMTSILLSRNIYVIIIQDESANQPDVTRTPDSIFPNNWFLTENVGGNGRKLLVLFPMCGVNRRAERSIAYTETLRKNADRVLDYTKFESQGRFLEGTGSLVIDHIQRVCYAAISPRTHEDLVHQLAHDLECRPVTFTARRSLNNELLYHTNVMLSIGSTWIVCCIDIIEAEIERNETKKSLEATGRRMIYITEEQMNNYCANVLQLRNKEGDLITVMSSTAKAAFSPAQLEIIGEHIAVHIPTIEKVGGGSARCMLAELFY